MKRVLEKLVELTREDGNNGSNVAYDETTSETSIEEAVQLLAEKLNYFKREKDSAEQKLLDRERRHLKTLEEIQDYAIISMDLQGNIQNWNKTAQKIKGYSPHEIIGKNFSIFYTDKDRYEGLPTKLIKEATLNGIARHEGWRLRKDGTKFWGNITIAAQYDTQGEVIGFNKLTRDLSAIKKSEDSVKLISERLAQATQTAAIGIWEWDVVNNKLVWDEVMYKLNGIPKESFNGSIEAWENIVHTDDRTRTKKEIEDALDGKINFDTEFRVVWPDSSVHYIKAIAKVRRNEFGKALQIFGTNWDITPQKNAENLLKESNNRNKAFVEQAPFAIAMFDTEMNYLAASKKWYKDNNLEDTSILGRSHYEIFPEIDTEWKSIHRECLQGHINKADKIPFKREDGTIQWLSWDVRPWYLEANKIGGLLMYTADQTEAVLREKDKKKLEEVLDKACSIAKIGAWEIDMITNTVFWDSQAKQIHEVSYHYSPTIQDITSFLKQGENQRKLEETLAMPISSWDEEVEIITGKGNQKWVRFIGQSEIENNICTRLYGIYQDITETKKDQEQLRLSMEQFTGAFEYSAIGMAIVSLEGKWLKVNKQLCDFLGYSEEELLTSSFQTITHPEDLDSDLDYANSLISGKSDTYQMEKRYFHKNGSVVHALLSVSVVRDNKQQPIHFISQVEDISKRKKAENDIIKVNQELTAILNSGHVSIIGTDITGRITHFSKGAEELLGYHSSEVLFKETMLIFHSEKEVIERGLELSKLYNKSVQGLDVFVEVVRQKKFESREWTYIRKNGEPFPVQLVVTAIRNQTDEIIGYLGIATDISEQKESESRFKSLLESAPDAMVIVNDLGEISIVNSQVLKLFRYNKNELEGQKVDVLIPEQVREQHKRHRTAYFSHSMMRPMGANLELMGRRKDGTEFPVEISLSPINTKQGTVVCAAIRDVTDSVAARRNLEQLTDNMTNRNKQLANFAHITSHNLRAPVSNLNSILHIYNESKDEEEKKIIFSKFEKVIHHLSDTLNELVEAVKIQQSAARKYENVSLSKTVDKVKEMLAGQIISEQAEITTNFASTDSIFCDKVYMESIIQNLISNSLKYRHPDRRPTIHLQTIQEPDSVVLHISDNGLGIDLEKNGHKLFGLHKTFHRHPEAKGVGLFLVKTQVEAMGGTISASSEVNKGITFSLTFNLKL